MSAAAEVSTIESSIDYFELRLNCSKLFNDILDNLKSCCIHKSGCENIIAGYQTLSRTFDMLDSLRTTMEKVSNSDDHDAKIINVMYEECITKFYEYEHIMLKRDKCSPFNNNMKERCLSAYLLSTLLDAMKTSLIEYATHLYREINVPPGEAYHHINSPWYYERSKILLTSVMTDSEESRDADFMKILENHTMIKHHVREIESIVRNHRMGIKLSANEY